MDKGYNPDFGARPLRRAIEQFVEDALSEKILRGDFENKYRVRIAHEEEAENLTFTPEQGEAPTGEATQEDEAAPSTT